MKKESTRAPAAPEKCSHCKGDPRQCRYLPPGARRWPDGAWTDSNGNSILTPPCDVAQPVQQHSGNTDSTGRLTFQKFTRIMLENWGDEAAIERAFYADISARLAAREPAPVSRELDADAEQVWKAVEKWVCAEQDNAKNVGMGGPGFARKCEKAEEVARKAIYSLAARATAESAPASAAPDAKQDQSNVMPPFAAPAGQHEASSAAWISTSERMPKDCEIVLVLFHDPHDTEPQVWSAQWLEGSETFESTANGWVHAEEVTHWMPLPPPPAQSQPAGSARQGGNTNDSESAAPSNSSPAGAKEST